MEFGVYLTKGKNAYNRFLQNRRDYKQYRRIVKDWKKRINEQACSEIYIGKVPKSAVIANGCQKEALETLQTTEFLEAFHRFLGEKGYEVPKYLQFLENLIPRSCGVAGQTINKSIIYNPRCIKTLDFRIPIHETGHLERHSFPLSFKMAKDNYTFLLGEKLKNIPFIKNLFKEHMLCHLSKKEQIALKEDYIRAYKEGYFRHNPLHQRTKELTESAKSPQKAKKIRRKNNQIIKDFRKHPEKYYMPNSQYNREEYIADYFNLAAQGFVFSHEPAARYIRYGGPQIGDVITAEELNKLEALKKQILKKSLSDYGYTWNKS